MVAVMYAECDSQVNCRCIAAAAAAARSIVRPVSEGAFATTTLQIGQRTSIKNVRKIPLCEFVRLKMAVMAIAKL